MALLLGAAVGAVVLLLLLLNRAALNDRQREAGVAAGRQAAAGGSTLAFLRPPQVWMCFAFFLLSCLAIGGAQSFAPIALHQLYGLPLAVAALAYSVLMLASAGGMLAGGFLAARTDSHGRLIAMCFIGAGSLSILLGLSVLPAVAVLPLMALIGFGAGVANPARDLLVRSVTPKGATGRVYGTVYSGLDAGMAAAPVLFGLIMDGGKPDWVFIAIGGFQFLALLTALTVGNGSRRQQTEALSAAEA